MNITDYKHIKYDLFHLMNKERFPQTTLSWKEYKTFNEIYQWAKDNCIKGKKTNSGGIAGGPYNRYHSIYFYNQKKASIELIIAHRFKGCYKFVITTERNEDNKKCGGGKALKEVFKTAEKFGVLDVFKKEAVDSDTGKEIKKEIESPIIQVCSDIYKGREFEHCYHIDANSSYFSRISEKYTELKPMAQYLYEHRKENNGHYKAVLTNSIGAMQSEYCWDINNKHYNTKIPYQLATFAKTAINGTNRFIEYYIDQLYRNGFEPLLINTDGIWYTSKDNRCFHDDKEGTELGQWKHDHKDVKLYIKSAGAYQYIEEGKVKTVFRGISSLDYIKPDRDTWEWKEIKNQGAVQFKFIEEKGIVYYE